MSIKSNLRDRLESTVGLVDLSVTKELISDIRGRIGKNAREVAMPAKYGLPGTIHGLAGTIVAVPVAVMGKINRFAHEQAVITRRYLRG